jgi:hypothetical protein
MIFYAIILISSYIPYKEPTKNIIINDNFNNIVILVGQSNIMSTYHSRYLPNISTITKKNETKYTYFSKIVQIFHPIQENIGPGYEVFIKLKDMYPNTNFVIIDCTEQINIKGWYNTSELYKWCINATKNVPGKIITILVYQGEADAGREYMNMSLNRNWDKDFEQVITSFRNDIGRDVPVIYAQIGILNTSHNNSLNNWEEFKLIQTKVNLSNTSMIKTDDQPIRDDVHHTIEANKIIGERFFGALMKYEKT